jgi:hypothetical protein
LLEAPGVSTEENNAALLVKAGRFEVMSRSAAAIALLTLQTMAPSGGSGHRTSLRGGGPLSWVQEALHSSHADKRREQEEAIARLRAEYDRLQRRLDAMYVDKLDGRIKDTLRLTEDRGSRG